MHIGILEIYFIIIRFGISTITSKTVPMSNAINVEQVNLPVTRVLPDWSNTLIYGYGEGQIMGGVYNGRVKNSQLTTITPLLNYLATLQQPGTVISYATLHAMIIAYDSNLLFIPKPGDNNPQRFILSDLDPQYVTALVNEIISLLP